MPPSPPAFLFDLDGTLYTGEGPIAGAVETIAELRQRGVPFRFVTNTTRMGRRSIVERLTSYGFAVREDELFTPAVATSNILRERGIETVAPFVATDLLDDLSGIELCGGVTGLQVDATPDGVLIGDLGDDWTPQFLNEAFRYVMDGAVLIALQKGRYWLGPSGLELDVGAYVAALEFASGREALLCGKPLATFFDAVVGSLDLEPPFSPSERPVMVGDDLWNDIAGAQKAGLAAWLVRTGKFREDVLEESGVSPDRVIGSVVEVI